MCVVSLVGYNFLYAETNGPIWMFGMENLPIDKTVLSGFVKYRNIATRLNL